MTQHKVTINLSNDFGTTWFTLRAVILEMIGLNLLQILKSLIYIYIFPLL